jgi:hypothetical protein
MHATGGTRRVERNACLAETPLMVEEAEAEQVDRQRALIQVMTVERRAKPAYRLECRTDATCRLRSYDAADERRRYPFSAFDCH